MSYANVRWISKFPDEQEWLMIPIYDSVVPTVDDEERFVAHTARGFDPQDSQSMWTMLT